MAAKREPPRLQKRNVKVFDSDGHIIAGFWQYGTLQWEEFYRYMIALVFTTTAWTIFQYDSTQRRHNLPCQPSAELGHYILLSSAGEPIRIYLVSTLPRPRNLLVSGSPASEPHYCARGRARDGKCLITGLQTQTCSRLTVTHKFPRARDTEVSVFVSKAGHEPSKITDTADEAVIGGSIKIDSVQNLITLRSDLNDAWVNYEFGVDPTNNYRITAFTIRTADINGLYLQLDHIQDPTLRPLDDLFIDHFMQGIFKHIKGTGEEEWTYEDYDDAFGDGSSDLSNPKIRGTEEGKKPFEVALADRLFDYRISQQQDRSETG